MTSDDHRAIAELVVELLLDRGLVGVDRQGRRLLKVEGAAERCAISVRSLYDHIAMGHLPVVRLSKRCVRIAEDDLDQFIEARRDRR